jgi:hypothetical protein
LPSSSGLPAAREHRNGRRGTKQSRKRTSTITDQQEQTISRRPIMAKEPLTVDAGNIPETLCIGRINLASGPGPLMTLTFTNVRPKAGPLFESNSIEHESVVCARIVTTLDNLIALRDLLNSSIQQASAPSVSSEAVTVH